MTQHTTGGAEPHIDHILQDLRNCDPEVVLKQVIPNIVKQGQNLMKNKKITVEQFSGMMKTVFQMKEQVMMHQAEKRHNNQQMISPWQDGVAPGDNLASSQGSFINILGNIDNSNQFPPDGDSFTQSSVPLASKGQLFSLGVDQDNDLARGAQDSILKGSLRDRDGNRHSSQASKRHPDDDC